MAINDLTADLLTRIRNAVRNRDKTVHAVSNKLNRGVVAVLQEEGYIEGFELVSEEIGLAEAIEGVDLVVTGEGCLDDQSFAGKAVGGVVELAEESGTPVLIVAGQIADVPDDLAERGVSTVAISDVCGIDRAFEDPAGCIAEVVRAHLA